MEGALSLDGVLDREVIQGVLLATIQGQDQNKNL